MNVKILPVFIIFFFWVQSAWAQDNVKSNEQKNHSRRTRENKTKDTVKARPVKTLKYARDGYVAISTGVGSPAGAFAGSGCATSGSVFSISAGFPGIISHMGIAFKFDYGTNSLNKNQFLDSLKTGLVMTNIRYSLLGKTNPYYYKTFLTGIYLTYPGKNLTIDARILGGVMMASVPAITVEMNDQLSGNNGYFYEGETSASAFAIDFGIEARYRFTSKFCAILSADYLHADPSFLLVLTGAGLTSNGAIIQETGRQTAGADQPFSLFNLSVGIGYNIVAQKPAAIKSN